MSEESEIAEPYRIPYELVEDCPAGWPRGWCEERLGEPILVLASRMNRKPRARPPWHVISHQTAGHACRHHTFWAMRLSPTSEFAAGMIKLEAEWFGSNVGWFDGPALTVANEYRASLKKHFGEEVDCDRSYRFLNEAIYPIDCSRELLSRICTDSLPQSFGDYFEDTEWPFYLLTDFDRAELYVLGANSD